MSSQQEQRFYLCGGSNGTTIVAPAVLSQGLVVGFNSTTTPLNLQDLANSGISSLRAYNTLGLELSWIGNPTGTITAQGNISGNPATMTALQWPVGGSLNPDLLPPDDSLETLPQPVAMQSAVLNPVTMNGTPSAVFMTWDLTKLRLNFLQLLVGLNSGSGLLTAMLSLMYQT